jgi:D-alanyl-D-alanine carboxypeptidase (penicillin-binding protein 5/6)
MLPHRLLTFVCVVGVAGSALGASKKNSTESEPVTATEASKGSKRGKGSEGAAAASKEAPAREAAREARESNGAPRVHAAAAIVVDAQSGKVLHALNADEERAVASTQKLMTALLVAEAGGLDKTVTIQKSDTWAEPSKLEIEPGEVYRKLDLLRILMVKSMNDVARALARDTAGSVEAFAERMNARARELGMKNSNFVNPNGLPAKGQHSTARDMAKLAMAAYKMKAIREAVKLKELRWQSPNGQVTVYHNTNRVLSSLEYCNGMKTGYTVAAGFCLVSSGSYNGRDVISVVLGDSKEFVWKDSHNLLVWALNGAPSVSSTP